MVITTSSDYASSINRKEKNNSNNTSLVGAYNFIQEAVFSNLLIVHRLYFKTDS